MSRFINAAKIAALTLWGLVSVAIGVLLGLSLALVILLITLSLIQDQVAVLSSLLVQFATVQATLVNSVRVVWSNLKKLTVWVVGMLTFRGLNFLVDDLLYPFVITNFGIIPLGGPIMVFITVLMCLLAFKIYDWSKTDWLAIEEIKGLKSYDGDNWWLRFFKKNIERSAPAALLILSIKYDPFVTTAYMRRGKYNGLSKRDWRIFWTSVAISNGSWILTISGLLHPVETFLRNFFPGIHGTIAHWNQYVVGIIEATTSLIANIIWEILWHFIQAISS